MSPAAHCIQSSCCGHRAAAPTSEMVLGGLCLPAGSEEDDANYICCLGYAITPCCLSFGVLLVISFWLIFLKLLSPPLNQKLSSIQSLCNFPSPTDISFSYLETFPRGSCTLTFLITCWLCCLYPGTMMIPKYFADIKHDWNFSQIHGMSPLLLFLPQHMLPVDDIKHRQPPNK